MPDISQQLIVGSAGTLRTFVDGTVRLQVDFNPEDGEKVMGLFGKPGVPLVIGRLTQEAAQQNARAEMVSRETLYGEHAKALRLSSFFRTPDVWRAVGSDRAFLDWLKAQPCAAKNGGKCGGDIVAAHVRRIENGAGIGIKPQYSAIPLCDTHHQRQHTHGELSLGEKGWFDQQRIKHVQDWAWETLKASLGYESWKDVPPTALLAWAEKNGVEHYLPNVYLGTA